MPVVSASRRDGCAAAAIHDSVTTGRQIDTQPVLPFLCHADCIRFHRKHFTRLWTSWYLLCFV
jgi:hypothetical protein